MENWASYALPQDSQNPIFMNTPYDQRDVNVDNIDGYPEFVNPWLTISKTAMNSDGFMEGKGGISSSSRSHSEAEKRRRDRINAQLAILRTLIPMSEKMDKAALLTNVVSQVKDLKKNASEINKIVLIPSDVDEVTVDNVNDSCVNNKGIFLTVSISCDDDRPELFSELNHGLKSLRLTIVHVDMVSLGGRVRCIFLLDAQESVEEGNFCMDSLKKSLKVVLSRIVTSCSTSNFRVKSRRQRFFFPTQK